MTASVPTERANEQVAMAYPTPHHYYCHRYPQYHARPQAAPVLNRKSSTGKTKMMLIMPSQYKTLVDLPIPINDRVKLVKAPAQDFPGVTFNGWRGTGRGGAEEVQGDAWQGPRCRDDEP
ncbi:hypothetical protein BC938DRAFT_482743 [Jimgerdemannia flammicorona]|uniref:Uncharacterized protein n=1 Tax=Jimgerdemannia flammicorona TaxID=994334 RepID=A0A433QD92_9FUNG|nr:hypothetical protein BC938DRAFT_482743 [Jimgerdemannia flammicorona]